MTDESTALEVIEGEYVQLGALQVSGPIAVIQQATEIATHLAAIVEKRKLYSIIKGGKHVHVEGWTTLGAMLGVLPREVATNSVPANDFSDGGYEAIVELVRAGDGAVIGRASSICTRDEPNWSNRPDYAVRSMAITRATGKAFRLSFSWIMTLAGYEPTPAEEMPRDPAPRPTVTRSTASRQQKQDNSDAWRTKWSAFVQKALSELKYNHMNHVINTLRQKWGQDVKMWNSDGTLTLDAKEMWVHLKEHQEAKDQ